MRCKSCGREGAYIRQREQDVYCRLCGWGEPFQPEKNKENKSAHKSKRNS